MVYRHAKSRRTARDGFREILPLNSEPPHISQGAPGLRPGHIRDSSGLDCAKVGHKKTEMEVPSP